MSALKQWIERRREEPKQPNYGPIGVYFTRERLQIVQLQRTASAEIEFRSHQSLTYPGSRQELLSTPVAVKKMVRRAMRAGNFQGRKVISAMPAEQVRVMSVSYPTHAAGSDAATIAKLMADRLDGSLKDYVLDYVPIRKSARDGERLALVAVSSAANVNRYLRMLDSAGLHVDHLEIGPLAIKRLIEWRQAGKECNNIVVVSFGETTSRLTTISGNRLLADQEVQIGEATVLESLVDSLQLEPAQARELAVENGVGSSQSEKSNNRHIQDGESARLIAEIVKPVFLKLAREFDRAFLFAESESHGNSSKKLFITGELARWPGMAGFLSALAKTPVESFSQNYLPAYSDSDTLPPIDDEQMADMSIAVGLALRGMVQDG